MENLIKFLILIFIINSCKDQTSNIIPQKFHNSKSKTNSLVFGQIDSCISCFYSSFLHNKDTSEFYYFGYSLSPDGEIDSYLEIEYTDSIKYCKIYDLKDLKTISEGHIELEKIELKKNNHKLVHPLYQYKIRKTKTWIFHGKDLKTIIYYPKLNQKIKVIEIDNYGNIVIDSNSVYDNSIYNYYNYLIF